MAATYRSVVIRTPDGSAIIKCVAGEERLRLVPTRQESFINEMRVCELLARMPPPVPTPRLFAADPSVGVLVFEAIDGAPLGPKRPSDLAPEDLRQAITLADAMMGFEVRSNWLYRLPLLAYLDHHRTQGTLTESESRMITGLINRGHVRWSFAHGDLSPRNILKRPDGSVVLIDWERAGVYPAAYDHAFLWYTTAAVVGARARIEAGIPEALWTSFLLSALLITLLHLDRSLDRPAAPEARADRATADGLITQLAARVHGLL
jgi:tRNA A-37 threonylcarbamoyl transferase component Bud32